MIRCHSSFRMGEFKLKPLDREKVFLLFLSAPRSRMGGMQNVTSVELTRDCDAVAIPAGNPVTLRAGTPVDISQTLGGTYTVHTMGGLYRISSKDADALGLRHEPMETGSAPQTETVSPEHLEKMVWDTLKTCYDPEIPVNIVDLGLIYDMHLERQASGGYRIGVKMTLTAPGCGMGTVIGGGRQQKVLDLPGGQAADVGIGWDPPWPTASD